MSAIDRLEPSGMTGMEGISQSWTAFFRFFSWFVATVTLVFAINSILIFGLDWPGAYVLAAYLGFFGETTLKHPLGGIALSLGSLQTLSYALCIVGPAFYVSRFSNRTLRQDAAALRSINNFIIRAAFWMVVIVGVADMVVSFLRVEDFLGPVVGSELATELGRPRFRGPYFHMPLIGLSLIIAAFTRSLSFAWLTLLVVAAELSIVLSRFIFSYEQAFQGDLVRFWYAALFLFSSAHTLYEDGHVRVDVLYSTFTPKTKGMVNAIGSVVLGMALCSVILAVGMGGKASIINSPLMNFEISQSGFGMYVKYLMAGFLAIFAVTMMIQFASTFLEGVADFREEPGRRKPWTVDGH